MEEGEEGMVQLEGMMQKKADGVQGVGFPLNEIKKGSFAFERRQGSPFNPLSSLCNDFHLIA